LLPECLDEWIDESNPVRAVDAFVDALDWGKLGFEGVVPEVTGRPSHIPRPCSSSRPGFSARRPHRPLGGSVSEDREALDRGENAAVGEGARRAVGAMERPRTDAFARTAELCRVHRRYRAKRRNYHMIGKSLVKDTFQLEAATALSLAKDLR
jgi:hypothetical protein